MINLTPHAITVRTEGGEQTFPPSGEIARVSTREEVIGEIGGVPVVRRTLGAVQGLPENEETYLVSSMVLSAIPAGTAGIYAPDTGPTAIRDEKGHIVAVTRLVVP